MFSLKPDQSPENIERVLIPTAVRLSYREIAQSKAVRAPSYDLLYEAELQD